MFQITNSLKLALLGLAALTLAACGGGGEAGIVGKAAGFLRQFCDLDAGGAKRAARHWQRDCLVAGIERDLIDCG